MLSLSVPKILNSTIGKTIVVIKANNDAYCLQIDRNCAYCCIILRYLLKNYTLVLLHVHSNRMFTHVSPAINQLKIITTKLDTVPKILRDLIKFAFGILDYWLHCKPNVFVPSD